MLGENDSRARSGRATRGDRLQGRSRAHRAGTRIAGTALLDELTTRIVTDGAESQRPPFCASSASSTATQPMKTRKAFTMPMLRRWRGAWPSLLAPTLEVADAVAVVPYDFACGFSPDLLIVAGFVNGFILPATISTPR